MKCKTCNGPITHDWRKDKANAQKVPLLYCKRGCSNKRTHSEQTKLKLSKAIKQQLADGSRTQFTRQGTPIKDLDGVTRGRYKTTKQKKCSYCGKQFASTRTSPIYHTWRSTCSDECFIQTKHRNARGNKRILFDGRRYDSQWEVQMVQFFKERKIVFEFPSPIPWTDANGKTHKYFPDFYLPKLNVYVDPKNPVVILQQREKLSVVSKLIPLLYGDIQTLQERLVEMAG